MNMTTRIAIPLAIVAALAGCSNSETPPDATTSATNPATSAAPETDKSKDSADLARIRELAEKEDAQRTADEEHARKAQKDVLKGLTAPPVEIKY